MECSRGKASPSNFVRSKLFANSGGFCQNPNCNENLFRTFDKSEIYIAEIAHIISVNAGARESDKLSPEEKGSYENLILLCPNCHTTIDKAENDFPEELILKWKSEHQAKIKCLFGIKRFESRAEARKYLEPLFLENNMIFETYGPNTDEKYNPESAMPVLWRKKIREFIIPNNRKILNLIFDNYHLLNLEEKNAFEEFKQHLHDFEGKHIFNSEVNGVQFPNKIREIYADR